MPRSGNQIAERGEDEGTRAAIVGLAMLVLEWFKAVGLPTIVVGLFGFLIARWQLQISREKLRHDLYERRLSIYMAFHELLLAVAENEDADSAIRKANIARAQAPFLLDSPLVSLLAELHKEAFRISATPKLLRDETAWSSPQDRAAAAARHGQDKLKFAGRVEDLVREFERFLRLKISLQSPPFGIEGERDA
jgi:hypothetical protein